MYKARVSIPSVRPSTFHSVPLRSVRINHVQSLKPQASKFHTSAILASRVNYDRSNDTTINLDADRRASEKTMRESDRENIKKKTEEWEGVEQELASPDSARSVLENKNYKKEPKSSSHVEGRVGEDVGDIGVGYGNVPRGNMSKGMDSESVKKAEDAVGSAYDVVAEGYKKNVEEAKEKASETFGVKKVLEAVVHPVETLKNVMGMNTASKEKIAEEVKSKASEYYDKAGYAAEKVKETANESGVTDTAKTVASKVTETAKGVAGKAAELAVDAAKVAAEKAKDTAKGAYEKVTEMGSEKAEDVKSKATEYKEEAKDTAKGAAEKAKEYAKEKASETYKKMNDLESKAAYAARKVTGNETITDKAMETAKNAYEKVTELGSKAAETASEVAQGAKEYAKEKASDYAQDAKEQTAEYRKEAKEKAKEVGKDLKDKAKEYKEAQDKSKEKVPDWGQNKQKEKKVGH